MHAKKILIPSQICTIHCYSCFFAHGRGCCRWRHKRVRLVARAMATRRLWETSLAQARGAEQVPDSRRPAGKENVGALDMDTLHWAQKRTPNTHIPGERKMSRQDHQCLELETAGSHQIPMHPCINDYLTARRNETVGNTLAMNSHILPPAAVDTTIAA